MERQSNSKSPHVPQGMKTLCPIYLHISGSTILHYARAWMLLTLLTKNRTYLLPYLPGLSLLSSLAS